MKIRTIIPAAIATAVLGLAGAASAQTAGAAGVGAAAANNHGAIASGYSGAQSAMPQDRQDRRDRNRDRRDGRDRDNTPPATAPVGATSTYGAGAVYTDRNSTSAGVTSGGSASGPGVSSTTSTVDAYGETGRNGTSADIYGNSTATTGQTPAPRTRPQ